MRRLQELWQAAMRRILPQRGLFLRKRQSKSCTPTQLRQRLPRMRTPVPPKGNQLPQTSGCSADGAERPRANAENNVQIMRKNLLDKPQNRLLHRLRKRKPLESKPRTFFKHVISVFWHRTAESSGKPSTHQATVRLGPLGRTDRCNVRTLLAIQKPSQGNLPA